MNKVGRNEEISLMEDYKVVSEDNKASETFKSKFEVVVENLGINNKYMSEEPVSDELGIENLKIIQVY